jgi:hypothetical protein
MLTRALAPWLLLAAFLVFPSLIAAGVSRMVPSADLAVAAERQPA